METDQFTGDPIDLSPFDDTFASAPAEDAEIPDGKYQVSVEKVELTRSQSSGNAMLKWTLTILGPECMGRKLWRNNVLVTDENVRWLKIDLKKCGIELAKLSELPGRLADLLDIKLLVTKKTNGDFTNVYITRRLANDEVASAPPF